ncbi:glycosyltransferase [Natronorubrum texcoconense]|uniref:Glycosyltransferase, catalytic subunit of cellulose synthase and poly-beta-1,6-N-acetylglucosamine synthase n=1 Tax=Natronorubrum texcoconense TaxID=1095776 RepID=A0A1G8VQQ9_9EURY|nr:glycosyltransferase [Natronorubrum texcoconense]SDJ68309.1 Glycosyltransferase, catalytic subunit of cellulose synthase and poly-beta-1,6-N-acetylglucosamine synthase [Natronorubrum texcoconense]
MILETILLVIFWGSLYGLIHSYFIYPLTLWIGSHLQSPQQGPHNTNFPTVALVIAAYNEEEIIGEKIENSLDLNYPDEKLRIVVFSDASSDSTDKIVKEYSSHGIELARIEGRVGKTACQNEVAEMVDEDILVFSDANSMYEPDAIKKLVQGFSSDVGCVVGELRYHGSSDVEGESVYWRYESAIKHLESRVNSLVTGNGSIYAVRSESYVPLSRDAISDFAEPLEIVRGGKAVKYVSAAIAWEETESSSTSEFRRRVRIVTRCWHAISNYQDLLNPLRHPLFAYQLWSHKILRWLSPLLLVLVFVSNLGLVVAFGSVLYQLLLAGQLAFYLFAVLGALAERFEVDDPLITHVPFYFLKSNYGMLLGLLNFLRGNNIVVWETSSRTADEK